MRPDSASLPLDGAPAAGVGASMPAGMQDMMQRMGQPAPVELYPTLMDVSEISPERRAEIVRRAREQMEDGRAQLLAATQRMAAAAARGDDAALQAGARQSREATALLESASAAHSALSEGRARRDVALRWFRREMSLVPPAPSGDRRTLFGVAPLHLFTMALLVVFALAMVALNFLRMRRATALFARIDPSMEPPPGRPPPRAGGPDPAALAAATPGETSLQAPTDSPASEPARSETAPTTPPAANWRGRLRVASIVTQTSTVKTFRLVTSSGAAVLPFTFLPGQFLNVSFWIGGAKMNRSYSISSSPSQREHLEITVRREPRGAVSRHIVDLLRAGDEIEAAGPVGRFTFTGAEADSIVLVSGGVGITPMMSIARWLTERTWPGDIYFIHACQTPADFIFADEVAALERLNPRLRLAVTATRVKGGNWTGHQGRITRGWLAATVPDLASRRVHLCGPPAMMDATRAVLLDLGVSPDQVRTELFGTPKPVPASGGTSAATIAPATGPLVTFSKHAKTARSRVGQTVLELSEALDIGIEYSCRVGTCGVCKATMTAGKVEMPVEDALEPDEKARGAILACQARPVTDVVVAA